MPSLSSFSAGWSWINGSPRVTLQLAAGTNPKIVSGVPGHMEIAITLDHYSHALPTMRVEAIARLDSILGLGDDGPLSASARQRFRLADHRGRGWQPCANSGRQKSRSHDVV